MHELSSQSNEVKRLIKYLNLSPHPEGGFFSENYRSERSIEKKGLPDEYSGDRSFSTAIYFLLPRDHISHFHKVISDEIWHFYAGGSLTLIQIFEDGRTEKVKIGNDIFGGQELQYVVPANCWFAAFPDEEVDYSLVGCTVSPGFDYKDFQLGKKSEMLSKFPQHKDIIEKYCL